MAQTYRLVGSQDPASRIDSVQVADQTLELNGEPMELDDAQVADLSRYVRLEPVSEEQEGEVVAEYTAEDYPDTEQNAEAPAQDQPVQEQQTGAEAQPEPQPEAQQVPRPRARREA
jgi:hypothetical protein